MKNFIFSLMCCLMLVATFSFESYASQPPDGFEDAAITMRVTPHLDMNIDSMGLAIVPGGVGLISQGQANLILYKVDDGSQIIAVIGNVNSDDGPVGVMVSGDGNTVFINAKTFVVETPVFDTHAEAEAALIKNQWYGLKGDKLMYRKL